MKLLFVCSGNTCRSPIAAGVADNWSRSCRVNLTVRTAGLAHHPGRRVAEHAVTVLRERGVDISHEFSKPVTPEDVAWADAIIPLQRSHADHLVEDYPEAAQKVRELPSDIHDPYCQPIAKYRECRDQLETVLPTLLESIADEIKKSAR